MTLRPVTVLCLVSALLLAGCATPSAEVGEEEATVPSPTAEPATPYTLVFEEPPQTAEPEVGPAGGDDAGGAGDAHGECASDASHGTSCDEESRSEGTEDAEGGDGGSGGEGCEGTTVNVGDGCRSGSDGDDGEGEP